MNPLQTLLQQIQEQELWEQELELSRNEYLKVSGSKDTRVYFVASGSREYLERLKISDLFAQKTAN